MANEIKDIYDNPDSEDYHDRSMKMMNRTKINIPKKGTLSHSSSKKKSNHNRS